MSVHERTISADQYITVPKAVSFAKTGWSSVNVQRLAEVLSLLLTMLNTLACQNGTNIIRGYATARLLVRGGHIVCLCGESPQHSASFRATTPSLYQPRVLSQSETAAYVRSGSNK
ncbi:hypothetical protein DPMN_162336 [Dreissena polymorpha]|uniref:Uncharacterized protein n=1 Tax=Dreissena polymorpha TaxID=45954 RepID=A0A9D4EUW4_DREPO|nr:hypothetical protein DPMN_162336 [Dreissena polymorpha]